MVKEDSVSRRGDAAGRVARLVGLEVKPSQMQRNSLSSSCGKPKLKHSAPCRTAPHEVVAPITSSISEYDFGSPKPYSGYLRSEGWS